MLLLTFTFKRVITAHLFMAGRGDPVKTQTKQASPPVEPQLPKTLTWVPKATNIITASFVQWEAFQKDERYIATVVLSDTIVFSLLFIFSF